MFKSHRNTSRIALAACFFIPALVLLCSLINLREGWDDGAITAAYARTYFQTGLFALTPVSPVAEGTSSLLWTIVLGFSSLLTNSVTGLLASSKILAAFSFSIYLLLFREFCDRYLNQGFRDFAVIVMALNLTAFAEIANGMEMNLYALLVLALILLISRGQADTVAESVGCALLSLGILLVRFESLLLLPFLYLGLAITFPHKRRLIRLLVLVDLAAFAAIEVWRFETFHALLPNTILAKRRAPYTPPNLVGRLYRRAFGVAEQYLVFLPTTILVLCLLYRRRQSQQLRSIFSGIPQFVLCMLVGMLLTNISFGKNWGAIGRMSLAFAPFFLLSICIILQRSLEGSRSRLTTLFGWVIAGQLLILLATAPRTLRNPVSERSIQEHGQAIDKIRQLLHKPTIAAMIPDIGGSALCCGNLNIIDTALLGNRYLAAKGYDGIEDLVRATPPDVIETHSVWSERAGMYDHDILKGYIPILLNGSILYVREQEANKLVSNRGSRKAACSVLLQTEVIDSAFYTKKDREFLLHQTSCIWLSTER